MYSYGGQEVEMYEGVCGERVYTSQNMQKKVQYPNCFGMPNL